MGCPLGSISQKTGDAQGKVGSLGIDTLVVVVVVVVVVGVGVGVGVVVVVEWLYSSKRIIIVRWADLSDFFR